MIAIGNITTGLEVYIYFDEKEEEGETEKIAVSSNGVAYESDINPPAWTFLGYERGLTYTESANPIVIFDHHQVAEIKKPRFAESKLTLSQLYTNMTDSIYNLGNKKLYLKAISLNEGEATATKEILYFTDVKLNTKAIEKPEDNSVITNVEGVYLKRGRAAYSWAMLTILFTSWGEMEQIKIEEMEG